MSIVCPGPVQTEFNRDFRDSEPKAAPNLIVSAEAVAQAVIKVIESKRFEVVLPRWLAFLSSLRRHLPNFFRMLAQRRFRAHVVLPENISGHAD